MRPLQFVQWNRVSVSSQRATLPVGTAWLTNCRLISRINTFNLAAWLEKNSADSQKFSAIKHKDLEIVRTKCRIFNKRLKKKTSCYIAHGSGVATSLWHHPTDLLCRVCLLSVNTLRAPPHPPAPSVILQSAKSYFTCPLISAAAFIVVIIQHLAFMALPDKSSQ